MGRFSARACVSASVFVQLYFGIFSPAPLVVTFGISFLGLGVVPPTPEWGAMIAEARPYFARSPWLAW